LSKVKLKIQQAELKIKVPPVESTKKLTTLLQLEAVIKLLGQERNQFLTTNSRPPTALFSVNIFNPQNLLMNKQSMIKDLRALVLIDTLQLKVKT
jgi:hypothetical protein